MRERTHVGMLIMVHALACASSQASRDASDADANAADAGTLASLDATADADAGPLRDATTCTTPAGRVALPSDDRVHTDPIEWWYWTGHLRDDDGRWFGFQHVFFRANQGGIDLKMRHTAITDVTRGAFDYRTETVVGTYDTIPDGFDLGVNEARAVGGDGRDWLFGTLDDGMFDLNLEEEKAPVLQHGDGYFDYPFGGYTYYYSRPRMTVTGTLTLSSSTTRVTGTAWFDHQWGSLADAARVGWDWFALTLDDRREIMVFRIRTSEPVISGSLTTRTCTTTELQPRDIEIVELGEWQARDGCRYPSGWDLTVEGMKFRVTPLVREQEIEEPIRYWEGAALVSGATTGRAYVELTGYCRR